MNAVAAAAAVCANSRRETPEISGTIGSAWSSFMVGSPSRCAAACAAGRVLLAQVGAAEAYPPALPRQHELAGEALA